MSSAVRKMSDTVKQSLNEVVTEAQGLLDSMRDEGTEKYGDTVHRLQGNVERARHRLESGTEAQMERMRHAARRAGETMHEHPWAVAGTVIAVGALAAALASYLLSRR